MITDKLKKTVILLALLVFAVFLMFALPSCAERLGQNTYEQIFSNINNDDGGNPSVDKYIIVLPSDCSSEIYSAAERLSDKIAENTETDTKIVYDYQSGDREKDEREILVGNTSRKESADYLKTFKINDFGYAYRNGVILIGGISESATISAIDKFISSVTVYADREILMNQDAEFFHSEEYEVGKVTLCGFELWDYSIVYPKGDTEASRAACELRDSIAERAGYYLSVKSDKECVGDERAICIGSTALNNTADVTCVDTEACILPYSRGISVVFSNPYGMKLALDRLSSGLLTADETGHANFEISAELRLPFSALNLSVLNVYPRNSTLGMEEIISIYDYIRGKSPKLIRMCGVSDVSAAYVAANLVKDYSLITVGGGDKGVYYLYQKENFEVTASETHNFAGGSATVVTYTGTNERVDFSVISLSADAPTNLETAGAAAGLANELIGKFASDRIIIDSPFIGEADTAFGGELDMAEPIQSEEQTYRCVYKNDKSIFVGNVSLTNTDSASYSEILLTVYK